MSEYELMVRIENNDLIVHIDDVANFSNNEYESVRRLIKDNQKNFERLGLVFSLDNRNRVDFKSTQLNEKQATFLMTLMRNNEVVTEFKLRLVEEFYDMREKLCAVTVLQLSEKDQTIKQLKDRSYSKPRAGSFQLVDRVRQDYCIQKSTHELSVLLEKNHILIDKPIMVSNFLPNEESDHAIRQGKSTLVYVKTLLKLVDEYGIDRSDGYEDDNPRLF